MSNMSKIVLIALCATVVAAYDFKDTAFNQYLLEDILDASTSSVPSTLNRFARAAEGSPTDDECKQRRVQKLHCCNYNIDSKHLAVYKGFKKECIAEIHGSDPDSYFRFDPFTCDKLDQLKEDIACVSECLSKKIGVLDDAGEIKRDALIAQTKEVFDHSGLKESDIEGLVDKCTEEAKKEVAEHADKHTCSILPIKMQACMWREMVRECPADLKIDSPKCNKMREKIESGDNVSIKGFYLRHLSDE